MTKEVTTGFKFPENSIAYVGDPSDITEGLNVSEEFFGIGHPKKMTVVQNDNSKIEVESSDKFGAIIPTTPGATAALRKALRENDLKLYVDSGSSVEFGSNHVPTGTVTNNSHLKVEKGGSVQNVQMSNSDITWAKGVLKNSNLENTTNGKDGLETVGGYFTNAVVKNSEIGMTNNKLSKTTLDNVVAGNIKAEKSDIAAAKATKTTKPVISNSSFKNCSIKTGPKSTFMDSKFGNTKLDTDLANNFDNATVKDANLTTYRDPKGKDGYTVSDSTLEEVISTKSLTAADAQIQGKPWHPVLNDAVTDLSKTTLVTSKGAIIGAGETKPVALTGAELDDQAINHNVDHVAPSKASAAFKALSVVDHGHYGKGDNHEIDDSHVSAVVADTAAYIKAHDMKAQLKAQAAKPVPAKPAAKEDEPEL